MTTDPFYGYYVDELGKNVGYYIAIRENVTYTVEYKGSDVNTEWDFVDNNTKEYGRVVIFTL